LESKKGDLFAEVHLGALSSVMIILMKLRFSKWFLGKQDMVEYASDLVGSRRDGLCCAELRSHAAKKFAAVALCSTQ
jgi:hypothetical protein